MIDHNAEFSGLVHDVHESGHAVIPEFVDSFELDDLRQVRGICLIEHSWNHSNLPVPCASCILQPEWAVYNKIMCRDQECAYLLEAAREDDHAYGYDDSLWMTSR